jgi:GNAT superfamily N-acetyltransferase
MTDALLVRPLTLADFPAWCALFERAYVTCYCRYWHFGGTKNDWLARGALSPEENAREAEEALRSDDGTAQGLIALDGETVVGWLKLVRRGLVPKLRQLPVYRGLDLGSDAETLSIACLLVDPAWRSEGIASRLVAAAGDALRTTSETGVCRLEAYPRHVRPDQPRLHDEEAWMGPERVYQRLGLVAGAAGTGAATEAYPVYVLSRG